jgi:hypothetical protein
MTDFDVGALCAEPAAVIADRGDAARGLTVAHLERLSAAALAPARAKTRPSFVAGALLQHRRLDLKNKDSSAVPSAGDQCADLSSLPPPASRPVDTRQHAPAKHAGSITITHAPSSHPHENCESAAWRIAADRSTNARKPRLLAGRLDLVATRKSWDGTKSKGRRDRVNEAEKFSAAVWHTAAVKGLAVSLNLGIRREAVLLEHADPRRRFTQNLSKHLSEAGLQSLPYALVFELTREADGGRLHLHGVVDTSLLSAADLERLRVALLRAASEAEGAVGGKRQLDLSPIYDPAGWADYVLKGIARTKDELRIDNPFMISKPMRRLAKVHFERLRSEVRHRVEATLPSFRAARVHGRRFTLRSCSDKSGLSGERDKMSAGGRRRNARHQPHTPRQGAVQNQAPALTNAQNHTAFAVATARQVR